MDVKEYAEIWGRYQQFSHKPGTAYDHEAGNFFIRVEPEDIADFKDEFGDILPPIYEKFLLEIGAGCLSRDVNSNVSIASYNEFPDLGQIAAILREETSDWVVYPDFIAKDEVPIFMAYAHAVFVLRPRQEAVFFPHSDRKFASSFCDFLRRLMMDTSFHEKDQLN